MGYVLGLDLGTSSLKGILVNNEGKIIKIATESYSLIQSQSGYSEQNPDLWITAADNVMHELLNTVKDFKENLEAISFSGQMHSLVLLDDKNRVLRNAILWNDMRTSEQSKKIMQNFDQLLSITKNRSLEGFTLPKILWVQEKEPEIWNRVKHILLPKDYLSFYMTGHYYTDYSDAAGTLLLDLNTDKWSSVLLDKYNIPEDYLPKLVNSTDFIGYLKDELLARYKFSNKIKVFAGAADNASAALGAGIIDKNTAMASIGTSGVFLAPEESSNRNYKGKLHFFHHAIAETYYSMGVTLAAGYSLEWFKKTFAPDLSFNNLLEEINTIPTGSDGLLFTPYIVGERTPHNDSLIRGSFIGIDSTHTLAHFAKSVIEGITFSLKDSQMIMEKTTHRNFKRIISIGGGAKSEEWLQIQANIFDTEVISLVSEHGPGLGATMIAAMGLKWFDSVERCAESFVNYGKSFFPQKEEVEKYIELYNVYKTIYDNTKNINYSLQNLK
ncbi:xylulokinase [Marinilactibacillus psychrotolerans]|uniref:xylulokinase n=1 Tax=Marinilactibacillus psychrotolerans TaxID=191770 RepID=UPI003889B681